jgi:hypothetical protein
MAVNRKYAQSNQRMPNVVAIAQTASRTTNQPISGDPCVLGDIPMVSLVDADSDGRVVGQKDGIFELLVAGIDSGGTSGADRNVHVVGGDAIYFAEGDTPPLSKRAGGTFFGTAVGDSGVELVASGATTTAIDVQVGR